MPDNIPNGITRDDVLAAVADYDAEVAHSFGPSTKFDLLENGYRYPPKAIVGLAARRLAGRTLGPADFKGGAESRCFRVLRDLGFEVVLKDPTEQAAEHRRNPPWARDELILALDLYFRHPPYTISQTHPEVEKLSQILNALPIHAHRPDGQRFRNANGVYMKLSNFLRYDPTYEGKGLVRGGKLEREIWNEFSADKQQLHRLAEAIASAARAPDLALQPTDDDEADFPEGAVLYRSHRLRERDPHIAKEVKRRAMQRNALFCQVCRFDFFEEYGDIGHGFIECHHTKPISEYQPGQKTRLKDLALVCANCHRMLHRRRPWLTLDELATLRMK